MPPNKPIRLIVSQELRSAIDEHCAAAGVEMSAYIRTLICEHLGRPELLDTLRPEGRPRIEPVPKTSRKKRKN